MALLQPGEHGEDLEARASVTSRRGSLPWPAVPRRRPLGHRASGETGWGLEPASQAGDWRSHPDGAGRPAEYGARQKPHWSGLPACQL